MSNGSSLNGSWSGSCQAPVADTVTSSVTEPISRIFLLSHMRAFTSLAGHILGSHPAINGYYEGHISYDAPEALDEQLRQYREHETLKQNSRYLFDKLLHNDYRLDIARLGLPDIKLLVCLREPEQTIKSIVNLFAKKKTEEPYASPAAAAAYYFERIKTLASFCQNETGRYLYYDAELLRDAPDRLLPSLSDWLGLDTSLQKQYRIHSQTGEPVKGDSSHAIRSGKIVQTKTDYSLIHIPDEILEQARSDYREYREDIIANADVSVTL